MSPTWRNWKDVRAEAVARGLIDEAKLAEGTAQLREVISVMLPGGRVVQAEVDDDEVDDDEVTEILARIGVARAELDRGEGLDAAALRDFLGEPRSDQDDHKSDKP